MSRPRHFVDCFSFPDVPASYRPLVMKLYMVAAHVMRWLNRPVSLHIQTMTPHADLGCRTAMMWSTRDDTDHHALIPIEDEELTLRCSSHKHLGTMEHFNQCMYGDPKGRP